MKEFVLNGDVVKRLLYNKPIINEDYTHNNIEYDFTNWDFNNNQPSEGITISKGKIIITKFKPNEPIIISNFTGDAANGSPTIQNICSISKELKINLKGISVNNNIFGADKAYNNNNILADGTIGYIYGLGFLPYKTTYREGRPLEKWGEMPFSCYVWGNITLEDDSTVQIASETTYLRSDIQGAYNRYGKINNYTNKQIFPNWKSWYGREEGAWYDTDFQLSIGLYTNVSPDANGFIELSTPVEISLIDNDIVDPTTQEVFKLYNKNELLYERDKTVENLYSVYGILLNATMIGFNNNEIINIKKFTNENDEYQNISLPVAIDLVSKIQAQEQIKFNIRQFDTGLRTNRFWETIISAINNLEITNAFFAKRLFCIPDGNGEAAYNNNVGARGMNSVKDISLDTITLTFKTPQSQNTFYFNLEDCFACVDWNKNVVVKYAASILNDVTLLYSVKTAVGFARNSKIKTLTFESPIALTDIANMLYHAREITTLTINFKNLYAENNGFPLNDEVVICNYAFCDCSLLYLSWGGDKTIVLHPWSVNVFYLSDIEEIASDNIVDLKFINPSVSDSNITNGIQILGSSFKTAKFKNLNMGNWTIDCPLDKNSVIYLLNNVYDLTSNLNGEYVPDDSNMFVHWYYWKNNNGIYRKVYHGEESEFRNGEFVESVDTSDVFGRKRQLRIDNYIGKKTFKWNVFGSNQTVQGYIRIYDVNENKLYEKQIDPNQGYYSLDGDITIDFSDYSGTSIPILEIEFQISTSQRDYFYYDIKPSYPGKSEASTITSANIVFTKVIYDSEFDTAIAVAQSRGWTIQFAS